MFQPDDVNMANFHNSEPEIGRLRHQKLLLPSKQEMRLHTYRADRRSKEICRQETPFGSAIQGSRTTQSGPVRSPSRKEGQSGRREAQLRQFHIQLRERPRSFRCAFQGIPTALCKAYGCLRKGEEVYTVQKGCAVTFVNELLNKRWILKNLKHAQILSILSRVQNSQHD